jgi:hypothetical protein
MEESNQRKIFTFSTHMGRTIYCKCIVMVDGFTGALEAFSLVMTRELFLLLSCWLHVSTSPNRQQAVATPYPGPKTSSKTVALIESILIHCIQLASHLASHPLASHFVQSRISDEMISAYNVFNRPRSQSLESPPKRQKMSSVASESTLAGEVSNVTATGQASYSVASEDLSSMVFHVVQLQRVADSWALHYPLTLAEFEMKASFKACEETANSLRDTLEGLEVSAASLASAQDLEAAISDLHDFSKNDKNDIDVSRAYTIKYVASPTTNGAGVITLRQRSTNSGVPHQGWYLEDRQ